MVAAVGSYLHARCAGGRWLLRMEDLDLPRCVPGADQDILRTLERFGFEWDGPVCWQSQRSAAYAAALEQLRDQGAVYPCACTRRELAAFALASDGSRHYPGTCRAGLAPGRSGRAWRVRVEAGESSFEDALQGSIRADLAQDCGDFVVRRGDGLFAYQLAVVVDDAASGVTDIVRGADLIDSTLRQLWLVRLLGLAPARYLHLPVAVNAAGEKLSKQTLAPPVDPQPPATVLHAVLRFLGQCPPSDLARAPVREAWAWAQKNWDAQRIPAQLQAPVSPLLPADESAPRPD